MGLEADLTQVDRALLDAEITRRDRIKEAADREKRYKEYAAKRDREDAEDTAFATQYGLTLEQYVDIGLHYQENYENRY